ncbi:acetate kinase [Thalassotalea euphylliae]|uniref:acetate kinase n=1 Tax=Thalassotalea euphylliae TaxID=1655234 RepID=UPI00363E911C
MNSKNHILVINCGSSSLKFALINVESRQQQITGIAQCLATKDANITFKFQGSKKQVSLSAPYNHQSALDALIEFLSENQLSEKLGAIGHRVVHGGETYHLPTRIDEHVLETLEQLSTLAPLHNPANIMGINAALDAFPDLPQVAVFDTAFHQTMPQHAYTYPIPASLYKEHGIRKYGFHGTSHYYVSHKSAQLLGKDVSEVNLVTAHLGNGCSVTSVKGGKSIDSSMGFTPLAGVAMGTRCGDIDPGIIFHLTTQLDYTVEDVEKMLNKESGLFGMSGISNDCRTLEEQALNENNVDAQRALDVFTFLIAKSIAAMAVSLPSLDGIVFTGGIGENSDYVRQQVTHHLSILGLEIDPEKNKQARFGAALDISASSSRSIIVMPTDEEWVIAEQTNQLVRG